MVQKIDFKDMNFGIIGMGKVHDDTPIDLTEYVIPKNYHIKNSAPVRVLPRKTEFTIKIGGTQYEVTTHFNTDGRESVLQQFKELILAKKLI